MSKPYRLPPRRPPAPKRRPPRPPKRRPVRLDAWQRRQSRQEAAQRERWRRKHFKQRLEELQDQNADLVRRGKAAIFLPPWLVRWL